MTTYLGLNVHSRSVARCVSGSVTSLKLARESGLQCKALENNNIYLCGALFEETAKTKCKLDSLERVQLQHSSHASFNANQKNELVTKKTDESVVTLQPSSRIARMKLLGLV